MRNIYRPERKMQSGDKADDSCESAERHGLTLTRVDSLVLNLIPVFI